MVRRLLPLVLACTMLPFASPAAQQEQDHRTYADATERLSLAVPADWQEVEVVQGSMEQLDREVLHVRVHPPQWEDRLTLRVNAWTHAHLTEIALRHNAHARLRANLKQGRALEFFTEPVPHAVEDTRITSLHLTTYWFTRQRGHGLRLECECARADLPRLRAALPALTASLRYEGPVWPQPVTEGRERTTVEGFVILHRGVTKADVKWLTDRVRDVHRAFVEVHGQVSRPPDEAPVIYLHPSEEQHAEIDPAEAAEAAKAGQTREPTEWSSVHRHVLTIPLAGRELREQEMLVRALVGLLLRERYGDPAPDWVVDAETLLAANRHEAGGRKLPFVGRYLHGLASQVRRPLTDLPKMLRLAGSTFHDEYYVHALVYVGLFHTGKRQWKEAYRAFLAELAATADGEAAAAKHLYSLDQDELLKDARAWAAKLRPWPADKK